MWKNITQAHVVEDVEAPVRFWTERFGFEVVVSIPDGPRLGFAAVRRDRVEIHYRSRASLVADIEALGRYPLEDSSVLTIEMTSVDEVLPKLEGVEVIIPRRRTFYGNNEVVIRAPGGQVVIFTAPGDEPTMMVANPFAKSDQGA